MTLASYAGTINARFKNTSSHLVDLQQRLDNTVKNLNKRALANWESGLKNAINTFKRTYPGVKSFEDRSVFRLCIAQEIQLCRIYIDTTMQREPDLQWILKIIKNFKPFQAQPIHVYQVDDGYSAWDSQHTALAMYLIAQHVFDIEMDLITVPAAIYNITNRSEIRHNFISNNTTVGKNAGKKALDIIDIFEQMIYGVEVDGVTDEEWRNAHAKWQHIAAAGMFLTAEKFNNHEQVGAISRLNEINDASVEVVRQFSVYGKYIVELQQRAINSKEIPIIIEFLNLCEQNQIRYSDQDIEDLAAHCVELFDANFDARGPYWDQCHRATVNAWERNNRANQIPRAAWGEAPKNNKNTPVGVSFFWHQLRKSWLPTKPDTFRFPKQPMSIYVPDARDLW